MDTLLFFFSLFFVSFKFSARRNPLLLNIEESPLFNYLSIAICYLSIYPLSTYHFFLSSVCFWQENRFTDDIMHTHTKYLMSALS